jgi:hypothetical protein
MPIFLNLFLLVKLWQCLALVITSVVFEPSLMLWFSIFSPDNLDITTLGTGATTLTLVIRIEQLKQFSHYWAWLQVGCLWREFSFTSLLHSKTSPKVKLEQVIIIVVSIKCFIYSIHQSPGFTIIIVKLKLNQSVQFWI